MGFARSAARRRARELMRDPFVGLMECEICAVKEKGSRGVCKFWRAIIADGAVHYYCPNEFPAEGAPVEDWTNCYVGLCERLFEERESKTPFKELIIVRERPGRSAERLNWDGENWG